MSERVAVVTGASWGIGEAVCRRLSRDGWRVAGLARNTERLAQLASELDGFRGIGCDVTETQAVATAFAEVRRGLGPVTALVANAGSGIGRGLTDGDPTDWRVQLEVNALAPFVCAREALADMPEQGHLVFMGSMSGHRVPVGAGIYSATKFALRAGVDALRKELRAAGRNVRVGLVSPGVVDTRFALADEDPPRTEMFDFELLKPADIADIVAYVLSAPPHVDISDVLVRPTGQAS